MDVYLSEEAVVFLRAEALPAAGRKRSGLLLGHRRGGRFFVERVYPCARRSFSSARGFRELDRLFEGRVIGFYSAEPVTEKAVVLNQPFAFNKVWIELGARDEARPGLKPFLIEFDGSFFLHPLALADLPKGKR